MTEINQIEENDTCIIVVSGEIDASSSIELDQAISTAIERNYKKILVDCSNLSYISSAGLGVFMSYIQDFENENVTFVLYSLSDKVRNVFQILGLDQLLQIVDTKEQAKSLVNEV